MKKEYIKPEMEVILVESNTQLLAGSTRTMEIYDDDVVDELYIL